MKYIFIILITISLVYCQINHLTKQDKKYQNITEVKKNNTNQISNKTNTTNTTNTTNSTKINNSSKINQTQPIENTNKLNTTRTDLQIITPSFIDITSDNPSLETDSTLSLPNIISTPHSSTAADVFSSLMNLIDNTDPDGTVSSLLSDTITKNVVSTLQNTTLADEIRNPKYFQPNLDPFSSPSNNSTTNNTKTKK